LLTDVVLSGERGTHLLAACRERRPSLPVVVMSGYTPDPSVSELLTAAGAGFLPKPFSQEQLLLALRGANTRAAK
jgi:DNA-binding NtrC family response regulator